MAPSAIYLHPYAYGDFTKIDFEETLSDLQYNPMPNQAVSEGATGQFAETQFNSRGMVRVVHERTCDPALARKLYLVEKHLKQGGIISVAVDSANAWAGYTTIIPTRGDNQITVHGQMWPFEEFVDIPVGGELELMSSQPYARREFLTNEGGVVSGNGPITTSAVEFAYRDEPDVRWTMIRHRGFWPALRLPKGGRTQPIVTHDHRISYTFDAQLEEAIDVLDALAVVPTESTTIIEVSTTRRNNEVVRSENQRPVQTGFGPGLS